MLYENTVTKIFESGTKCGADFVEVFVEESIASSINLMAKKIDEINSSNSFGIGIRLLYGSEAYYGYSSDADEETLLKLTGNLGQSNYSASKSGIIGMSKSLAIEYAKKNNIHFEVIEPQNRKITKKSYADNFTK